MSHIRSITLDCGMPLVTEVIPAVRSAAVSWLLPCGSAVEPVDRLGMSAMWAELLLRGAGDRDSRRHADALDRLGANRSASNGTYTFSVSATTLGTRLLDALPLIADMVLAPRMDEASIGPARDLCVQAIESLRDDPQERAVLAARERHLPTPINRSGLGTPEGLAALSREELRETWRALAHPGRAVFAAAGAVDPAALEATLNRLLRGWSGTTPEPGLGPPPPRGYAHETDQTNQVQIVVAHDAPPEVDPLRPSGPNQDALLERLAVAVLSGGMSGRLFSEVREKRGLCYSVSAAYRGDRDFGLVSAYVGTTPERAQESLDVLLAELRRINEPAGRVTREEFDRAVVGMKTGLVFSGESTAARAGALAADYRRFGRARALDEIAARIDAVTLDELNAYLARRSLGRFTIQTLGPKPLVPPG